MVWSPSAAHSARPAAAGSHGWSILVVLRPKVTNDPGGAPIDHRGRMVLVYANGTRTCCGDAPGPLITVKTALSPLRLVPAIAQ